MIHKHVNHFFPPESTQWFLGLMLLSAVSRGIAGLASKGSIDELGHSLASVGIVCIVWGIALSAGSLLAELLFRRKGGNSDLRSARWSFKAGLPPTLCASVAALLFTFCFTLGQPTGIPRPISFSVMFLTVAMLGPLLSNDRNERKDLRGAFIALAAFILAGVGVWQEPPADWLANLGRWFAVFLFASVLLGVSVVLTKRALSEGKIRLLGLIYYQSLATLIIGVVICFFCWTDPLHVSWKAVGFLVAGCCGSFASRSLRFATYCSSKGHLPGLVGIDNVGDYAILLFGGWLLFDQPMNAWIVASFFGTWAAITVFRPRKRLKNA